MATHYQTGKLGLGHSEAATGCMQ